MVQETESCIEKYIEISQSNLPKWFDYADEILRLEPVFYNNALEKIAKALKPDVSWRFLKSGEEELPLYRLDRSNMTVTFTRAQANDIKQASQVLAQLLNFKWAELLEKFNSSPRIVSKVRGLSETKLRRSSLTKFKGILLESAPGRIVDFYTGEELSADDISVDHVIPWSFMYSDDIWNLVITSKSNNSKKSNRIPSDGDIEKLNERNAQLLETITDSKIKSQLQLAITENYVNKFYIALKL